MNSCHKTLYSKYINFTPSHVVHVPVLNSVLRVNHCFDFLMGGLHADSRGAIERRSEDVFVCVLKVSFRTSVHRQSFTVEVCVIDKNDNVPTFIEESMRGSVQLGLLKGTRTLSSNVKTEHKRIQSGLHLAVLMCNL